MVTALGAKVVKKIKSKKPTAKEALAVVGSKYLKLTN
jgi:hypothetical protein